MAWFLVQLAKRTAARVPPLPSKKCELCQQMTMQVDHVRKLADPDPNHQPSLIARRRRETWGLRQLP